jgi:O-antigen/teichoic acid export membrane protein
MPKRRVLRDIFSVSAVTTISIILHIPIGIIMARMLGPEGNGIYTFVLVIPMLVNSMSQLGIRRSIIFFIGKKIYNEKQVISALLNIIIVTALLGIVICMFSFYVSNHHDGVSIPMIILAILTIPIRLITNYAAGIFIAKEQIRKYNLFQWVPVLLNLITIIVLVVMLKLSVLGAIISYVSSLSVMATYAIYRLHKQFGFSYSLDFKTIKDLLFLGIGFSFALSLMRFHNRVDILILKYYCDFDEVGYYSMASRLAERWQGPLSFTPLITAWVANAEEEFKYKVIRFLRILFLAGITASITLYFLVPYIIPFLYGRRFIPSIAIVQIILPGITMLMVTKTLASYFAGIGKPMSLIISVACSLIINIILNFILIPLYGAIGAAITTDISYTLLALVLLYFYTKNIKMPFFKSMRYDTEDFKIIKNVVKRFLTKLGIIKMEQPRISKNEPFY